MLLHNFLYTPLEQFSIIDSDLFSYQVFIFISNYDISFFGQIIILICFLSLFIDSFIINNNMIIKTVSTIILFCYSLAQKSLGKININFFLILLTIVFFITFNNVFGMITYNVTPTAQLILTFFIAAWFIHYINNASIILHGSKFFSLFFPSGSPLALSFLIVPIELVSYFFRKISLSVRLFANMMAGHTLLKVIVGFIYTYIMEFGISSTFILANLPLIAIPLLIALTALEFGVALIQGYVFLSLVAMYAADAKDLH